MPLSRILKETLTNREREVLQRVAEVPSSTEIAEHWTISSRNVETQRPNFMRKLHLNNQTELIRFAIRKAILSIKD